MKPSSNFHSQFVDFSVDVMLLSTRLPRTREGRHIADQLLRSGTSVGAHLQEARSAESRADFIHKLQMSLKELREAGYWLLMTRKMHWRDGATLAQIADQCEQLTAILAKSVITAKKNVAGRRCEG